MNKKITYILIITFFLASFLILMYAFGYRVDIAKNPEVVPTGGVFVKEKPAPSLVILNGENKGQTSQLTGEFLIQGLKEGVYSLEVVKDGYQTWKKHVRVLPHKVSEFKFITLFRNNYKKELHLTYNQPAQIETSEENGNGKTDNIAPSADSADGEVFKIIKFGDGVYGIQKSGNFFIFFRGDFFKTTFGEAQIKHLSKDKFALTDDFLIFLAPNEKSKKEGFLYDLVFIDVDNGLESRAIFPFPFKEEVRKFFVYGDNIFLMSGDNLYMAKFEGSLSSQFSIASMKAIAEGVDDFYIDSKRLFFIEDAMFQKNLKVLVVAELNDDEIKVRKKVPFTWYHGNMEVHEFEGLIFIKTGDSLFVLNGLKISFLQGNVSDFSLSPDEQKVVILSSKKIILFYVKDREAQPERKKFDKVYLMQFQDNVSNAQWLDGSHLIAQVGNKILVVEVDDRSRVNNFFITEMAEGNLYYDSESNTLFFIERNGIYKISDFIEDNLIF